MTDERRAARGRAEHRAPAGPRHRRGARRGARPIAAPIPAPAPPGELDEAPSPLRRVGRGLGYVGGGMALLGALAIGLFPTQTFLEQRSTTAEVEERLEVLRAQNEAFEARIEALQTDEEIERVAREQYNLVYPGEEAYAVLPAPLPPLELPPLWPYGEIYAPALSPGQVDASLDAP